MAPAPGSEIKALGRTYVVAISHPAADFLLADYLPPVDKKGNREVAPYTVRQHIELKEISSS